VTETREPAVARLRDAVLAAAASGGVLHARGGGSKDGLGGTPRGEPLATLEHAGIVDYDPAELVVTVRAGTPLAELQAELAAHGQMLPFEPPDWPGATVGGMVACGLAGPRRAFVGGVRDALLGVRLLDGQARVLQFGGRVMKNVAGFDLFRPQAGAWGRLGLLLELSFRLLPQPQAERTLALPMAAEAAIEQLNRLAGQPLPMSGAAWFDGQALLRLSGSAVGVDAACRQLAGEGWDAVDAVTATAIWQALRRQELPGADRSDKAAVPLWRLVLPGTAEPVPGTRCIDWCGALRWIDDAAHGQGRPAGAATSVGASTHPLQRLAASLGGHATPWRDHPARALTVSLDPARLLLHRRLFEVFDPHGVFANGRLGIA